MRCPTYMSLGNRLQIGSAIRTRARSSYSGSAPDRLLRSGPQKALHPLEGFR
jgi:hypothetical protein